VVYFLAGAYNITSLTIDYYYTQIIGNPNNVPIIKADKSFHVANTFGLLDGGKYAANGLGFGSTNTFYRQVRNIIFDMTAIAAKLAATGIHWPTAQATSIHSVAFKVNDAPGSLHRVILWKTGREASGFR
jgi:glucan 1,3-beta-glucosidase